MDRPTKASQIPEWPFREHVKRLDTNILREILKVTDIPGVISFAGGMPAPELFPYEGLLWAAGELLGKRDPVAGRAHGQVRRRRQ